MSSKDTDLEVLDLLGTSDCIFQTPCSRYERFINMHCNVHKQSQMSRQNRFKNAQTEWSAAKKDGSIDTVYTSLKQRILDRGVRSEVQQRSNFKNFFAVKRPTQATDAAAPAVENPVSTTRPRPAVNSDMLPTPTEVRMDQGKKQDILDSVKESDIQRLLQEIDVDSTALLTPDVTSTSNFMDALSFAARRYRDYHTQLTLYKAKSTRSWGKSKLQTELDVVQQTIVEVKSKVSDALTIDLDIPELSGKIQSANNKLQILTRTAILLSTLGFQVAAAGRNLKQRVCAIDCVERKKVYASQSDNLTMNCLVGAGTSWSDAVAVLDVCAKYSPLTFEQLCAVPMLFKEQAKHGMCFMPARSLVSHFGLSEALRADLVQQLTETFPVMLLEKNKKQVLVDIHEFVVNGDLFEEILTLDDPNTSVSSQPDTDSEPETSVPEDVDRDTPGRTPLTEQYPMIVPILTDFLRCNGFKAQERRRTETGSCGVTLKEMRQHLQDNIPGLTMSLKSVHRLLKAPRKGSHAADRHSEAVDARPGVKSNNARNFHQDQHHCASQVKTAREFGSDHRDRCVTLSCDDKSKIGAGRPAVSRYHQLKKFFIAGDDPDYSDHDFPTPGYLICPSGYMVMKHPQTGVAQDTSGRDHLNYGHTGPVGLFNRACLFHPSNMEKHVNDLLYMSDMREFREEFEKPMMVVITDGGPDWSPQSPLVAFYYGRLWQALNLDLLVASTYAPGHSALNPIEHAWAPISGELAGLVLPDKLPGERLPPAKQKLGEEQKRDKEATLFDDNLEVLSNVLKSKTFDGHQVTPVKVPCTNELPGLVKFADYEDVRRYFKVGISTVYGTPTLAKIDKEWQLYSRHVDKRQYSVVFRKCKERGCSYCHKKPIQCTDVLDTLPSREQGALFYAPTPAEGDHYKTYLELKAAGPAAVSKPCTGLTSVTGRCTEPGCCWVFSSAADRDRHTRLVHRKKESRKRAASCDSDTETASPAKKVKAYTECKVCNKTFPSPHYLSKHKKESGHGKRI